MSAEIVTMSRPRRSAHRIAALSRAEGGAAAAQSHRAADRPGSASGHGLRAQGAPAVVDAGGSRGAGAMLLTGLTAFALLLAVFGAGLSGLTPESSPRAAPSRQAHPHHRTLCRALPASRVTLRKVTKEKPPGSPDSCEAPTLLVTHRHTDLDESLSAHRHFENKSTSIEVRYGPM